MIFFCKKKKKLLLIYVFTANAEMSRDEKNAFIGKSFFSSTLSQQKKITAISLDVFARFLGTSAAEWSV